MAETTTSPSLQVAPGPRGLPLLGNVLEFRRDAIEFMVAAWRTYGDVVRFKVRSRIVHLLARPEAIQHVLVHRKHNYFKGFGYDDQKLLLGEGLITSEGALWERQHRLLQPFFTPKGVTQFAESMIYATANMLERWHSLADDNCVIQVDKEMARLTGNIIVRVLFNLDLDEQAANIDEAFQYCTSFVDKRSADLIASPLFIPTPANRRFQKCLSTIHRLIDALIEERRRRPHQEDLLSLLLQTRDEETGERMSDQQVRDELVTLFVAGYQTTMFALTWTWYRLSERPDVAERLWVEQSTVLGGRVPTLADLEQLHYTGMVFQEVMRLYPPVKVFVREAIDDDEIGGYHIPGKSLVLISPYITHHHPGIWERPDVFDPERFGPEQVKQRSRYAYIPFSTGPRICLGNNFALLEAAIVLIMVTQQYRLQLVPGHPVEPSMEVKTRPLYGMPMKLHRRISGRSP